MQKITKSVSIIAIVSILIATNSCIKEDESTVWNPDGGYPFVLPDSMQPYQYAIYEKDMDFLFGYIELKFEEIENGEEKGYFILSFNTTNDIVHFGFITETSSYYSQDIRISPYNPINFDDMCFGLVLVEEEEFDKKKDAQKWAMEKKEEGCVVTISYCKLHKKWLVLVYDEEDDD